MLNLYFKQFHNFWLVKKYPYAHVQSHNVSRAAAELDKFSCPVFFTGGKFG